MQYSFERGNISSRRALVFTPPGRTLKFTDTTANLFTFRGCLHYLFRLEKGGSRAGIEEEIEEGSSNLFKVWSRCGCREIGLGDLMTEFREELVDIGTVFLK